MVKELSNTDWKTLLWSFGKQSSTYDPSFLNAVSDAYQCRVRYYMSFHKEQPVVGIAVYEKGSAIILPSYYIYSAIWLAETEKSLQYRKSMTLLLNHLKSKYRSVHFRLSPELQDVRPFLWEGFSATVRYTYFKSLPVMEYSGKMRSRIRRAEKEEGIRIEVSEDFEAVWEQQAVDLRHFYYSESSISRIKNMFANWHQLGFLLLLTASKDGLLIASACILLNPEAKTAANLLISSNKVNYQTGVHAALYKGIFCQLEYLGYQTNDLIGANMKSIADFKANFDPQLRPYFELRYSYRRFQTNVFLNQARDFIKRIVRMSGN